MTNKKLQEQIREFEWHENTRRDEARKVYCVSPCDYEIEEHVRICKFWAPMHILGQLKVDPSHHKGPLSDNVRFSQNPLTCRNIWGWLPLNYQESEHIVAPHLYPLQQARHITYVSSLDGLKERLYEIVESQGMNSRTRQNLIDYQKYHPKLFHAPLDKSFDLHFIQSLEGTAEFSCTTQLRLKDGSMRKGSFKTVSVELVEPVQMTFLADKNEFDWLVQYLHNQKNLRYEIRVVR